MPPGAFAAPRMPPTIGIGFPGNANCQRIISIKKKPKSILDVYQIDDNILSMLVGSPAKVVLEPGQSHSFQGGLTAAKAITGITGCPRAACVSENPVAKVRAFADLDLDAFFRITSKAAELYPLLEKK